MKDKETINGENIIYHILQKRIIQSEDFDSSNPPDNIKFLIEQLLLGGGIWFRPATYQEIPVLLPYVVRDPKCRKKNPATGKDSRGIANDQGLMPDDNSSIKGIPNSLMIESNLPELRGRKGIGFVASHIWRKLQTKNILASHWERTNSFIPNLVWLPKQLSKLTDREGSYAQRFVQHISGLLYRDITLPNPMLNNIWNELNNPNIEPVSVIDLNDLNYFEHNEKWVTKRKGCLKEELQSILYILDGKKPIVTKINTSNYVPSLTTLSKKMDPSIKTDFEMWIKANIK